MVLLNEKSFLKLCMLIAAAAMFFAAAPAANAAVTAPEYDESAGGYQIGTPEELYWFASLVNGTLSDGTEKNTAANAVLTTDITINENVLDENGDLNDDAFEEWTPIGDYVTARVQYSGTFDGAGHVVSGIYVARESNYVGMFGYLAGTVKNLTINDSYLSGIGSVGGAVGNSSGVIESVIVKDSFVKGTDVSIGGVCGSLSGTNTIGGTSQNASIKGCGFEGHVAGGKKYTGGVIGLASSNCPVTNSFNKGSVIGGTGDATGGVVGRAGGGTTVSDCYNLGSVTSSGGDQVGGVCGYIAQTVIKRCYNAGEVTCSGTYVGAIAGYIYTSSSAYLGGASTIESCYYIDVLSCTGNIPANLTETNAAAKSAEAFNSGEAAWLLQSGASSQLWGQQISLDDYPLLSDDENDRVIKITFIFINDETTSDAYTNYNCILASYPTSGEYEFYADEDCTEKIDTAAYTYSQDTTVYAMKQKALGVKLIDGAQIRIGGGVTDENRTGEGSGLRFIAQLATTATLAAEADEIGIAIFDGGFGTAEETEQKVAALTEDDVPTLTIPAEKYQSDSVFSAAIVNINTSNYNRVYIAVPYVTLGEETYYDFNSAAARSPYQVASGLLVEGTTTSGYEQSASETALKKALNAYANETGARLELTYSQTGGFAVAEAQYSNGATAFFTANCENITNESGAVIGARITLTGKNEDVIFCDYWQEYIKINNKNSTAVKYIDSDSANISSDRLTLTFDFYLEN